MSAGWRAWTDDDIRKMFRQGGASNFASIIYAEQCGYVGRNHEQECVGMLKKILLVLDERATLHTLAEKMEGLRRRHEFGCHSHPERNNNCYCGTLKHNALLDECIEMATVEGEG